jgi:hypothetical protein
MALYEMRTYTLYVGKMAEAQKLYTELGSVRGRCPAPGPLPAHGCVHRRENR